MKQLNPTEILTRTDVWLTPPELIRSLGEFDLDPCSPVDRPWSTAKHHLTEHDDGLLSNWFGRVWLNPPYSQLEAWLNKIALHGNGITLTFARTDTKAFQNFVFPHATSLLFLRGRLTFYDVKGLKANSNGGAPSVLIGYGEENSEAMEASGLSGFHIPVNSPDIFIVSFNQEGATWQIIVRNALAELKGSATTSEIYEEVVRIAPKRVQRNRHYKEKIRQVLQHHFTRQAPGKYSVN